MYTVIWLGAFAVLLVIELLTLGLTTIWFAAGALIALLASLLGLGLVVQIVLFIIVSVILLLSTRPIAMKHFNKRIEKTNVESLIGQTAVVIEDIDTLHAAGRVSVKGQEWSARTASPDGLISKGTVVTITEIQGVKLIVKQEEKSC